jgi:small subunit ribosomal protein S5
MERKVKGHGLRCQRCIKAIAELAGIKDMRAKIVGTTNPMNIVRATFKGLVNQQTYEQLAEKSNKFVVEFREEEGMRPKVVAIPSKLKKETIPWINELQLLHSQFKNM